MQTIILLLSLVSISACTAYSSRTAGDTGNAIKRIDSTVEYVGPGNMHLLEAQYPKDVVLMFPYISGSIFGLSSELPLYITKVDEQLNFSVDLIDKLRQVDETASPLSEEWTALGLTAEPQQARITRIGTFPYSYDTGAELGVGGFIDMATRNTMILVYVDRPCQIKGEVDLEGKHYFHHITFSEKGFHWIEVLKRSSDEFILQSYHGVGDINFSIHIENLQLI